ncbi:MAG: TRAP transporter small permease subunit, partial [Pseudomonadota bacterium]
FVQRRGDRTLRNDADSLSGLSAYIIRAAFWAVLFVGFADMAISFLRVEELLPLVVGEQLASDLGRSTYRGTFVHLPLMVIAVALAAFTRTLGFTWLALLVVIAELFIVLTRFVFSYEQAFQGDLVRFWYAALFLFASAYTLIEEGHVRVDVVYAGLSQKNKGLVNAIGCVVLGMSLCWTVLILGMWSKTNIIVSPLLSFEVSQSGFGMYVKYLMAGFLGVFAVSMMIQFTSYLLDSVADYRGDPGHRETDGAAAH